MKQKQTHPHHSIFYMEALWVWLRVAALSFGGPAGQIAVMHRILVEEKRWVSENRFLHALNYCMLLPGPEAQQLATYIGWLLHGTRGGLTAGILFILPGFFSILALSILYVLFQDATLVQGLFFGLKSAVLAVVIEAVYRIGKRALKNNVMIALAALSFIAIFFLRVPFPVIILGAAAIGIVGGRWWPQTFFIIKGHETQNLTDDAIITDTMAAHVKPTLGRAVRVAAIWLGLWLIPIVILALMLGGRHVLVDEAIFFSKAATVTFGGAYAVLGYVQQQAVEIHGWLQPGEMLDGLGMAETTPGPLIQVVQFVGFMGAYRDPAGFAPMTAALLGSAIVTWVTFVPCFLWIFLGAPYIEHLRGSRWLRAALSVITAAVVGVILNLAVWFSLHVIFPERDGVEGLTEMTRWGVRWFVPNWTHFDVASALIAAGAFAALFKLQWGMIRTLGISTAVGLMVYLIAY